MQRRFRRWVPLAGLLACVIAGTGHAQSPAPAPTGQKGTPKPRTAQGSAQATSAVVATWSYLKMHQPATVVAALRQRQAGKIPAIALDGLAGPSAMAELLKPTWANVVSREPTTKNGSVGRTHTWQEVSASQSSVMSLPTLADVTPYSLDYSVFGSGVQTRSVWGEAPQDGRVTASISGSSAFHVVQIIDYDGTVTGSGAAATLKEWDSRSAAPFEMAMQAGQSFQVQVAFDASLGEKAGTSKATLDIVGSGWSAHVPLKGAIVGLSGSLGVSEPATVLVVADPTNPTPQQITLPVVFKNDSQAFKGVLSSASMPRGVSLGASAVSFDIGAHETKTVNVPLVVDTRAVGHGWQSVTLTFKAPGGTSPLGFEFDSLPPLMTWTYSPTNLSGGASITLQLTLGAGGLNAYDAGFSVPFPDIMTDNSSEASIQGFFWSAGGGQTAVNAQWGPGGAAGWSAYVQGAPTFRYKYTWLDPSYLFL